MEDEGIDTPVNLQTKVEDSMPTSHFLTTPLTPDYSSSPPPLLPPPAPESHHNLEPPSSPPLEAQTMTKPIPETQQANPTTTKVQSTKNPSTEEHQTPQQQPTSLLTGLEVVHKSKHKSKIKEKKKKE